jgi:hypothetical protein
MLVFGLFAVIKNDFRITSGRKVKGSIGRILGFVLILGTAGALIPDERGILVQALVFVAVVAIGFATSEKIEKVTKVNKDA